MKYSLASDSYIGGMYTGREMDTTSNRVVGIDGQIRVGKGSSILYNAFLSSSINSPGANPIKGHLLSAEFEHDSRNITYSFGGKSISENFNAETGFINRDGINYFKVLLKPKFYPDADFIQRLDLEAFSKATHDNRYDMWETVDHLATWIFFRGSTYIKLKGRILDRNVPWRKI